MVAEAVDRMPGAFTVEDLAERVDGVGLATIYRSVAALVESGWLERVGERGDSGLYMRCGEPAHHHHIVCERCGKTVRAECDLERLLGEQAAREGFVITRHDVAVYGVCSRCATGSSG